MTERSSINILDSQVHNKVMSLLWCIIQPKKCHAKRRLINCCEQNASVPPPHRTVSAKHHARQIHWQHTVAGVLTYTQKTAVDKFIVSFVWFSSSVNRHVNSNQEQQQTTSNSIYMMTSRFTLYFGLFCWMKIDSHASLAIVCRFGRTEAHLIIKLLMPLTANDGQSIFASTFIYVDVDAVAAAAVVTMSCCRCFTSN